jgi:NADH:ubiquinone oxidoreductase subunit F (NADH-binding)/NAD-dependent dihydropyrimidine dehydrogenase PreA subunit
VETLATVSAIFQNGESWFARYGTERSKGTKTFSLAGKVVNTGLIEVPMGIPLRTIIYDIGGGIPYENRFKAVQTGGPSGGCLPVTQLDLPVEYESLAEAGSIIGSGGMIAMDEETCIVDSAKYFLTFVQHESCGKCIPCRWGTKQMLDILEDITNGSAKPEDIDLLVELSEGVKAGSLCGLGQTAPNPVLSTIRYFRDEYEEHIHNKRCPAGVCKALIKYEIDSEQCKGCGICLKACPHEAIRGEKKKVHTINQDICQKCGICKEECKFDAIKIV